MTTLSLGINDIGNNGAKALGAALNVNGSLTSLDLNSNSIGKEGALAIASALEVHRSLMTLDLSWNQISLPAGLRSRCSKQIRSLLPFAFGKEVAAALLINGSLTRLNLEGCSIGAAGCKGVAVALRGNGSPTSLDLHYNDIGEKTIHLLEEAAHARVELFAGKEYERGKASERLLQWIRDRYFGRITMQRTAPPERVLHDREVEARRREKADVKRGLRSGWTRARSLHT